MREISQSPNFVLAESQFLATQDELQPLQVHVLVASIAVFQARRLRQQPDLFVVPDGLYRTVAGL